MLTSLAALGLVATAAAQDPSPTYTWTGNGGNSNYSNGGNWLNGSTPGYGILVFGTSTINTTVNVDTTGLNQHELMFNSASAYTLNGNGFTFYDYSGYPSKIENNGGTTTPATGLATINVATTFASGNAGNTGINDAQINAVTGDITFGTGGTITMTGGAVYGLQLYGTGHTVTFNGVISDNGGAKYFEINGGNTAVFNAANTYTGNTDVYNGSTLQFAAGGSASGSIIRTGNDDSSGVTAGSGTNTVSLINATGGQNITSILVTAAGNTLLSSTNTSGTNTYSGSIYLDSPLTISATAAGGTFAITGGQFDLKSQALTITGPGVVNVNTVISNSTSGGTLTYSGAGTVLLNGANSYSGATTINSGTLGGTGSVSGPVNVNTATINPGQIGAAGSTAAVGTLTTGALTLTSGSTSVFDLASTTSYDQLNANGAVTLAGTLTINLGSTIAAGTVLDLVHGTSLTGTYSGIINNGTYTFGGEQFTAMYTGSDFELVAVPEPATYLGGLLLIGVAGYRCRHRFAS